MMLMLSALAASLTWGSPAGAGWGEGPAQTVNSWVRLRTFVSSTDTQQLISAVKPTWGKHKSSCTSPSRQCRELGFAQRSDLNVQEMCSVPFSLEVSPCLEPSYCLQKNRTMKLSPDEAEDVGLVKYLPKSLLLPINTFAGVIQ